MGNETPDISNDDLKKQIKNLKQELNDKKKEIDDLNNINKKDVNIILLENDLKNLEKTFDLKISKSDLKINHLRTYGILLISIITFILGYFGNEKIDDYINKKGNTILREKAEKEIILFNNALDKKVNGVFKELENSSKIVKENCIILEENNMKLSKMYSEEKTNVYLNTLKFLIIEEQYQDALLTISEAKQLKDINDEDKALIYGYECMVLKLLDKDTVESEKNFEEILKKDFFINNWHFKPLDNWLEKAKLSEEKKVYIKNIIDKLKSKQK